MTVDDTDAALQWLDAYEKSEREANEKLKNAR